MRIIRDVPHPNNFAECEVLMSTRTHARRFPPFYLPITDALILIKSDENSYVVTNEGIPFITFHRNGTALLNSCGMLVGEYTTGPINPMQDTLFNRLTNCLNGTNWGISSPAGGNSYRLFGLQQDLTPIYYPFKDLTIIKLGTPQIWQPSPSSQLVTRFSDQPTLPTVSPAPSFNPDPRLRGATISPVGPALGGRYWIRAVTSLTPAPPTEVVLPSGQFALTSGLPASYHWTSEQDARDFIARINLHFQAPSSPAPTPQIPRSPLITQDTSFSIRGPVRGLQYPHPYWISVSNPVNRLSVLHPNGVVDVDTSNMDLYGWDTADAAHAFIQSLLDQEPRLTCSIEMPSRRTP